VIGPARSSIPRAAGKADSLPAWPGNLQRQIRFWGGMDDGRPVSAGDAADGREEKAFDRADEVGRKKAPRAGVEALASSGGAWALGRLTGIGLALACTRLANKELVELPERRGSSKDDGERPGLDQLQSTLHRPRGYAGRRPGLGCLLSDGGGGSPRSSEYFLRSPAKRAFSGLHHLPKEIRILEDRLALDLFVLLRARRFLLPAQEKKSRHKDRRDFVPGVRGRAAAVGLGCQGVWSRGGWGRPKDIGRSHAFPVEKYKGSRSRTYEHGCYRAPGQRPGLGPP